MPLSATTAQRDRAAKLAYHSVCWVAHICEICRDWREGELECKEKMGKLLEEVANEVRTLTVTHVLKKGRAIPPCPAPGQRQQARLKHCARDKERVKKLTEHVTYVQTQLEMGKAEVQTLFDIEMDDGVAGALQELIDLLDMVGEIASKMPAKLLPPAKRDNTHVTTQENPPPGIQKRGDAKFLVPEGAQILFVTPDRDPIFGEGPPLSRALNNESDMGKQDKDTSGDGVVEGDVMEKRAPDQKKRGSSRDEGSPPPSPRWRGAEREGGPRRIGFHN